MQAATEIPSTPGRGRITRLELALWIGAFLVARMALALAYCDVFAYLEEFEKAAAGKAMLDGLSVAHHELAYHYYEGGGFFVSHLDAVAFALFGASILSVKLVALALGAAILGAGWVLCRRVGGVVCARAFALLFVFAPASMQQNSLLALGIHFHATLFIALALLAVVRLDAEAGLKKRTWIGLGFVVGFGLYFSYQLALTVALVAVAVAVAIVWRLRRAESATLVRGVAWAACGAGLGLAPLAAMSIHVGRAVLDIHGADVLSTSTPKLELLRQFFDSLCAGRSTLDFVFMGSMLAAPFTVLGALRSRGALRWCAWFVVAHVALFLAAYLGLGFTVGKIVSFFSLQRLAPLWFLGALGAAFGVAACYSRRETVVARFAFAIVGLSALGGAVDAVQLLRAGSPHDWFEHARKLATTKGYAYPQYLQKISSHVGGTRLQRARLFGEYDEEDRELLIDAIAVAVWGDGATGLDELESEIAQAGFSDPKPFLAAFGMPLRNQLGGDIASRLRALAEQPERRRAALAEAIGRFGTRYFASADAVRRELEQGVAAEAPSEFFFGLGMRMWGVRGDAARANYHTPSKGPWALDDSEFEALASAQSASVASALRAGFEHAAALQTIDGNDASRR